MKPIRKILIVGGGTSGWTAAAMLSTHLRRELCQVELVESEEISALGIGESTIPPFVRLIQQLGVDEQAFMQATQACYKLGIKFVDWRQKNSTYFHPFGTIGQRIGSHEFYQCWLRSVVQGNPAALQEFSPCSVMAAKGRFFPPQHAQHTPIGSANYAMHVDARQLAGYLRRVAEERGVTRIEGRVTDAMQNDNGHISQVLLSDGRTLGADFFIDCTGFQALLIDKLLHAGFEDWSHYLPCDRAIAVKTAPGSTTQPYTTATARRSGWSWRIPLRGSTGHGYVYSSKFCSDAEAKSTLLSSLETPRVTEPMLISFTTGRRKVFWKNNCLALGLAAGFVEPLESTAIHLVARGVDFFLRLFPDRDCEPSLIREYNRRMALDYEEVRDFILLHYVATQRQDTPFWQWCRNVELPDSLAERIALFKARGTLPEGIDELFKNTSWQSVFEGMGIRPGSYCPRVEHLDLQKVDETLARTRAAILAMVESLPSHDEYLQQTFC
jgi:tryptophan halogenase